MHNLKVLTFLCGCHQKNCIPATPEAHIKSELAAVRCPSTAANARLDLLEIARHCIIYSSNRLLHGH